jgi:DNA polymerase
MMIDVSIDFETYYDSKCSLSKLNTVEYICHPDFHVIGLGIKINTGETHWLHGDAAIRNVLDSVPWDEVTLIAHNAAFDAQVLRIIYGKTPSRYLCTMFGARPHLVPYCGSGSLAKVAAYLGLPAKGTTVAAMKGRTYESMSAEELLEYGVYCINDVDLCYGIAENVRNHLNDDELTMISLTVKKAIEPQLKLAIGLLQIELLSEIARKATLLARSGLERTDIMSNPKFAEALMSAGISPPMKISPTTGKEAYAFAKTDLEFQKLLSHKNSKVRELVEVRLGSKSTLLETRLKRMIAVSSVLDGYFPFPLIYYGAKTGRFSGADKLNAQNLPKKGGIRSAIIAPKGHKIVVSDLSQIEARIVAWLAGQEDLIDDFSDPEKDVYCEFGTSLKLWGTVTKATVTERFISKMGVLSLMYGAGNERFHDAVNATGQAVISKVEATKVVDGYRGTYTMIPKLWRTLSTALEDMIAGKDTSFKFLKFIGKNDKEGISAKVLLPEGRVLHYPNLCTDLSGEISYQGAKHKERLYGAHLLENISQALAQIIIRDVELKVARDTKFRITAAGQAHDELIYVVPEKATDKFAVYLNNTMKRTPVWADGLVLDAETEMGDSYGEAK